MKRWRIIPVLCLAAITVSSPAYAKGQLTMISIDGDGLSAPIQISDKEIISQFNIWNGPGTRVSYAGSSEEIDYSKSRDPKHMAGRFVDWPSGYAEIRPAGLQRLEVKFHISGSDPSAGSPTQNGYYIFAYEVNSANGAGYIFLPQWKNGYITHGVEGRWLHASKRWNELIQPIVQGFMTAQGTYPVQKSECTIGIGSIHGDGSIELLLQDDNGNRRGRYLYKTTSEQYQGVKDHVGDMQPNVKRAISCWPMR